MRENPSKSICRNLVQKGKSRENVDSSKLCLFCCWKEIWKAASLCPRHSPPDRMSQSLLTASYLFSDGGKSWRKGESCSYWQSYFQWLQVMSCMGWCQFLFCLPALVQQPPSRLTDWALTPMLVTLSIYLWWRDFFYFGKPRKVIVQSGT